MREKTHQCKLCKQSDCLRFIHSYYVSQIRSHILIISKDIVQIFTATVLSTFLKKSIVGILYSDTDRTVTWQWWMKIKSSWDLLILIRRLLFVFTEMLDKLIIYIECWYKTLHQVLPVQPLREAWTNRITTCRDTRSDPGSHINTLCMLWAFIAWKDQKENHR